MPKLPKYPQHQYFTDLSSNFIIYQIILIIVNYQIVLNSDYINEPHYPNYKITLGG